MLSCGGARLADCPRPAGSRCIPFEGADSAGTPLADWLRGHDVDEVDVVGIATDYCVHATAADAARAGFGTRVLLDLTAGVAPESTAEAISDLRAAGVDLSGAPIDG